MSISYDAKHYIAIQQLSATGKNKACPLKAYTIILASNL